MHTNNKNFQPVYFMHVFLLIKLLQTTHENKSEDEQKAIDRNRKLTNLNRPDADIPGITV